jgi:hypothetical protein
VVGEHGAELFVPHTAGTIVPSLGSALTAYAASRGMGYGMGPTLGGLSLHAGSAGGSRGQGAQNTVLPVTVADDRNMAAMLAGGHQALLRHFSTYSSDINQVLNRNG